MENEAPRDWAGSDSAHRDTFLSMPGDASLVPYAPDYALHATIAASMQLETPPTLACGRDTATGRGGQRVTTVFPHVRKAETFELEQKANFPGQPTTPIHLRGATRLFSPWN